MSKFDGDTNIVKNYDWTSAPRGSGYRKNAPVAIVTSYKLKSNQILSMLSNYLNIVENQGGDSAAKFYDRMYGESTEKEDTFNFPFFSDNVRSFSNNFGDTFQSGIGGGDGIGASFTGSINELIGRAGELKSIFGDEAVGNAAGQIAKGDVGGAYESLKSGAKNGGNPGTYIETPMFYQFEKNDGPLEITFTLSNTINDDNDKNYKLIKYLTKINRPLRLNSIAVDPPRIFRVKVPGHRNMRWASCQAFNVNLMGTRRLIPIDGNPVIVPDAYQISMSFQSLTLEHGGFLDDV